MVQRRPQYLHTALGLLILVAIIGCGPNEDYTWGPGDATIRGLVKDHLGQPLGQASVVLEGSRFFSTYTDKDGRYEINDIEPGLYDLVVKRTIDGVERRYRLRYLELRNDLILDMPDVQIQAMGTISGLVTLRGSGQYNPSYPDNANTRVEIVGTNINASTDGAGNYTLTPVEMAVEAPNIGQGIGIPIAATYDIHLTRDGYAAHSVLDIAIAPDTTTTAPAIELIPLNPSPIGAIAGRVFLEAPFGDDHANVTVTIDGTTRSLVTTSGGYFRFDGISAGVYSLRFERDYYFDRVVRDVSVVSGIPVNPVDDVTMSTHQKLNDNTLAYDLSLSPSGNQLAFITSDATAGGEIALMHTDGLAFNQVITENAHAVGGRGIAWSPDETELLFIRYVGSPVDAYTIGWTDDTGSNVHSLLTSGTDYHGVTWAPTGDRFAFYLTQSLYSVFVDRSQEATRALTHTITTIVPIGDVDFNGWNGTDWAMTGRIVYGAEVLSAPSDIWTVLAGGTSSSMPLQPTTAGSVASLDPPLVSPTFSLDWSRIAFSVESPSTSPHGIYVCDIDGRNARRLTEESGRSLCWAPSNDRLYYLDPENNISEVLLPQF